MKKASCSYTQMTTPAREQRGKRLREERITPMPIQLAEDVRWEFREVLDVKQLLDDEMHDGSEIYYAFLTRTQLESVRAALAPPAD